jgi:hypothetical protein
MHQNLNELMRPSPLLLLLLLLLLGLFQCIHVTLENGAECLNLDDGISVHAS